MKRNHLFLLALILLFCSSCGVAIKKLSGYKDLKVESKETVNEFVKKNNLDIDNNYFLSVNSIADKEQITNNFLLSVTFSMFIYDHNGQRYCYNGTEECSGTQLQQISSDFRTHYTLCQKDEMDQYLNFSDLDIFLDKLTDSSGNKIIKNDLPVAEFYIFELWNIYSKKKKHIKEDFEWTKDLAEKSDVDFAVVYVNTDLLEEWGLEKGEKVKTKFKYNRKSKNVSLTFGELPLK